MWISRVAKIKFLLATLPTAKSNRTSTPFTLVQDYGQLNWDQSIIPCQWISSSPFSTRSSCMNFAPFWGLGYRCMFVGEVSFGFPRFLAQLVVVVKLEGGRLVLVGGIPRTFMSIGSRRYWISSSWKTRTISSSKRALLAHFSPMSWKFILCVSHTANLILFNSSTSFNMIIGEGCQCSFLFSM